MKNSRQTNITGACIEQTARDFSLTSVDGTHSIGSRMRVVGWGAHVAICHLGDTACLDVRLGGVLAYSGCHM